ncbi:alpha/beta fold hydrolase [Nocardioides dongkuii]|uniref:alpha/beta fold hydrolase n=1 Tax=Nocardioides dongkuii TaxID=2760089 RepID=UPI0015FA6E59|nr:alpha/beta fold hydrolase [Nocardioides dongkuii]
MDLIPKPGQVVSAAGNVAHLVLGGGVADLRPMPRTLVEEGPLREVHHYRPAAGVRQQGDPVLLVTPLAAPARCYDLRRGCSLVEHLVAAGRPTYLVEYGEVDVRDRELGMEPWVDEVVPRAIEAVSAHAGGRPVHLVGWSLGGILALLTAADRTDLPIASVSVVGSPTDVSQVPLVAPPRPLLDPTEGRDLVARGFQVAGAVPGVRWAVRLPSFQRLVAKPLAVAAHLDDSEFLAQVEAVDRFTAAMAAYSGRAFGQLYHRFVTGNALVGGSMELSGRTITLSSITAPVLVLAGTTDGIAPVAAVKAVVQHLAGARDVRFEIVPGGHLGMLTGRAARTATWPVLDEWFEEWTSSEPVAKAAAKKKQAKKAAARKKAPDATPRKAAGKRAPAARTAPSPKAIGANPKRRYGSGGSRSLSP